MLKVGLVGVGGGGGRMHVTRLLSFIGSNKLKLVAFCETNTKDNQSTCTNLERLGAKGYTSYLHMYEQHPDMDLIIISAPIHLHKEMCIQAFKKGFNVFLEKPPVVTFQDFEELIFYQEKFNCICAVNFQRTCGRALEYLLNKLKPKEFGQVKEVIGIGLWRRSTDYFSRSRWSGKLLVDNTYVLDGGINNPLAHLIQNCILAAGSGVFANCTPKTIQAELYHCNNIEGDDTSCFKVETINGINIFFYGTLCNEENKELKLSVKCEKGTLSWYSSNKVEILFPNGSTEWIDFKNEDYLTSMYVNLINYLEGKGTNLYCTLADCRSFIIINNGAYLSSQTIYDIASNEIRLLSIEDDKVVKSIANISDIISEAAEKRLLLSELEVCWAKQTKKVDISKGKIFDLFLH